MSFALLLAALLGFAQVKPAINALAITPDGKGLLYGSQAGVRFRPFEGSEKQTLATALDHVYGLAFSPDGKMLAIAGGSPAEAGRVELWSWPDRKLITNLEAHDDVIYAAVWIASGTLATASADRAVRIWDVRAKTALASLKGHSGPVLSLAVSPDGKWLCSGSSDQTIRVWNTETWQPVRSLDNHLGAVHQLAFRPVTPEGQPPYLASAGEDGTVRIWQPTIGRMVRIVKHPVPVFTVCWSKDGELLHTGGKDGMLRTVEDGTVTFKKEQKITDGRITTLLLESVGRRLLAGTSRGEIKSMD